MAELYEKLQELFPNDDERGKIWAALLSKGAEDRPLYFLGGDAAARSSLRSLLPSPVGSAAVEVGAGDGKSKAVGDARPSKRLKATKAFTRLPTGFELPFLGRDNHMQVLAKRIDKYFNTFATSGISREEMLFVALEGLAGAGKTRFLLEAMGGVRKYLTADRFAHMNMSGAVEAVYITFNGSAIGSSAPHSFSPMFEDIIRSRGSKAAGSVFMKACVASEILYQEPFVSLPQQLQLEIVEEDIVVCLKKLAAHVREGLGIADGRMVALYLLVDESQMLAREVIGKGGDGVEFLKGMLAWVGNVMTSSAGECSARQAGLCFIPLLGGTVLPVVGKYGVSDWLKATITLEPLDMNSAVEVLRLSVMGPIFAAVENELKLLLDDCSCLARLVRYIYSAWSKAAGSRLEAQDLITHLRTSVVLELKVWVDAILGGNRAMIKRMIRLCLTGIEIEKPTEGSLELAECRRGYVYAQDTQDGVRFQSPMLLLHALCLRLGISNRIAELAKGDPLEYAFLDMLHARMRVYEGTQRSIAELFSGATGADELLTLMVEVSGGHDSIVKERNQFYNPKEKRFFVPYDGYLIGENDGRLYSLPCFGDLFKCREGSTIADARLFMVDLTGVVYEIWIQIKGQKSRVSVEDANKWAKAALHSRFQVNGRKKIFVLCSANGFVDATQVVMKDVLLLDLQKFMAEFLRRSI